ncbi:presenilins-associated rhomboid-like protein, mitochondrial [Pollicipes pollicipes]|uniref:presenilins-associated rhomboid-like protein, mitochondrial n=1 Tax=Pollicipes pollicipes TaxID=41117 RepID=UPI0018856BA7|nr:presenilins-associated rhomboid-like protein, mitochondrial [Pollicipes pollicipes]
MLRAVGGIILPAALRLTGSQVPRSCIRHVQAHRQLFTGRGWLARFGGKNKPVVNPEQGDVTWSKFVHASIFTVVGSGAILAGCVIWEYEGVRAMMRRSMDRGLLWGRRQAEHGFKRPEWRNQLHSWWASQTDGQKLFWPLCLLNVVVFLAWKVPAFSPTMLRYFASTPASPWFRLPMLLSGFSHYSFTHLAVNMFVLHSFSTGAVAMLGKEQFLGLYLSGALVSSLGSYLYKMFVFTPAVSMGASGAIMAVLGFVCTESPDSRLAIIFLPMFTFTAGTAIKAVMAFDTLGAVLRWNFFDHAAHLGGALFGVYWSLYGRQQVWERREPVIRWYHNLREATRRP